MDKRDYYQILGVSKNATKEEIRKAYKKKAIKFHPDKLSQDKKKQGEEEFKKIGKAYAVLNDERKRKLYDMYGEEGEKMGEMPDMSNFNPMHGFGGFESMFNFNRKETVNINPIRQVLKVELKDLYYGIEKKIKIERKTFKSKNNKIKCSVCNGTGTRTQIKRLGINMMQQMKVQCDKCNTTGIENGKIIIEKIDINVKIEPGTKSNENIIIKEQGNDVPYAYQQMKKRGDIYIIIEQKEHETFKRKFVYKNIKNEANLYTTIEVKLSEAICGFRKQIKHLDDRIINIEELEPIKDNQIKIIIGEGMPYKNEKYRKGDLFINYKIIYPTKLTYDIKKKIYKLLEKSNLDSIFDKDIDTVNLLNIEEYENMYNDNINDNTSDNTNNNTNNSFQENTTECRTS
mgnify:CR=1 FL=1